jgi:competence ComEA-like helix-hairpin-helix protein
LSIDRGLSAENSFAVLAQRLKERHAMVIQNANRIGWLLAAFLALGCLCLAAQTPPAGGKQILKGKTVNINKATAEELVKNVPLVNPELAKRIVQYRKDNGDFQTLEELLQVEGFNRDLLRRIKTFLLLEGVGGKDCTC